MTWKALEPLVQADPNSIRAAVRGVAEAWGRKARRRAIQELTAALEDQRAVFILRLLNESITPARRIGLELIPGMSGITANLRRHSREALRDGRLPHAVRLAATKALLRGLDPNGKGTALLLRAYVAGLGRKRILERLDEVAKEFDNPPAMEVVRAELRTLEKLRCPRCGSLRRRKNMSDHLWNRHQMLLVGHRARTATQALDERLAVQPPAAALVEFHRDLLGKGLHDEEAIAQLRREAAERDESVCPHCFAFVPVTEPPALQPAEVASGRISADGCLVALGEAGGKPRLRIQSDTKTVFSGPDPESSDAPTICRRWAVVCAIAGIVAAVVLPVPWHLLSVPAAVLSAAALLSLAYRWSQNPYDPLARVIDIAWQRLIPELLPGNAMARFALASVGRGSPKSRSAVLAKAITDVEQAASLGAVFANVASPLWWLQFADDRGDPVPALIRRFRRCIDGEMLVSAAAGVFDLWWRDRPSRADRARMRALLGEQAFESGLGVWDIVELGRAFPPLGSVLATDDIDGLARLCHVWEQRLIRPWQPCGPAATIFELARNAELSAQVLDSASDLLLYHRLPALDDQPAEPLFLCHRGMVFRDAVLREPPGDIRVRHCEEWRGGGYEVRLGPHRLRFTDPPGLVVEKLKIWASFFLGDFLPRAEKVLKYRASDRLGNVLGQFVVKCPACTKSVIPLVGRVGVTPTGSK
jgi:hypothetical protein